METEFGTNQAVWSWELSDGDKDLKCRILFEGMDEFDFYYDDPDRTVMLDDKESIGDFIEYCACKLNMSNDDKEQLDYMIRAYNWSDIRSCIDIIDNDTTKEFHEFLIKYNFRIYLSRYTIEEI